MHNCLNLKSSSTSSTQPTSSRVEENSSDVTDGTPRTPGTSTVWSPTVNLSHEYALAVQSTSYTELWDKIHVTDQWENDEPNQNQHQQLLLSQVLQPSSEFVQEALKNATQTCFTQLISSYFEHTEETCHLLLLLHHIIHHARSLYKPIHDLVSVLPSETEYMTQLQINRAFDVFTQFEQEKNPFPCPDSHNFHNIRVCFSELKQQVDLRLNKSQGKLKWVNCGTTSSATCLIVAVIGVTVSAIVIATHALVALVALSSCPFFLPSKFRQKEMVNMGQLDAAARSAYVLHNDLDTIDRLVERLYTAVEGDKLLIRLGLDRGRDKHPIYEVVKQLRKTRVNFMDQLKDMEQHICLCFAAINRTRALLLQEIDLQQD